MEKLSGKRFGKWLVMSFSHRKRSMYYWRAKCDCGFIKAVSSVHLLYGRSTQCANCRERERTIHGHAKRAKYGGRLSPTYLTWRSMNQRCYNPTVNGYERYGGAGIRVCARWRKSFRHFLMDMGVRPDGRTLDRKDGSKNYTKSNCRWATRAEQSANRRINK